MTRKRKKEAKRLVVNLASQAEIADQFRTIRTNVQFAAIERDIHSIVITSAVPGEGKSTVSANLAAVFAQQGKKVLLADMDLRRPTVHRVFSVPNFVGLTSILQKKISIEDAVIETNIENLTLLTSGPIPPSPSDVLSSKAMKNLLNELKEKYELIIYDTPPLLSVSDAEIISEQCDGVILVISTGRTELEQVKKAKKKLMATKVKIFGAVLNNVKKEKKDYYYNYSKQ